MDEISLALFKLLVALLEHSYTQVIANLTSPQSIILLQRLHMLTCFPGYYGQDENISDLGLPIWAYLQEEITDNGIVATQSGFGDPRWATVKEVFDTLVEGLCRKATLPSRAEFITWPKGMLRNRVNRTSLTWLLHRYQANLPEIPYRPWRCPHQFLLCSTQSHARNTSLQSQ